MDIPALATSLWTHIELLLPVIAAKGAEEAGKRAVDEVWEAIRSRFVKVPATQRVTEKLLREPQNPTVQGAFQDRLEEALETDPAFAATLTRLLEGAKAENYTADVSGSGAVALGSSPHAVGAHGVMANDVRDIYTGPVYQQMPQPMAAPQPSKKSSLPTQPYFFGRVKELDIIAEALLPTTRTWGALIDGPGGIGKTALAIRAAYKAPAELFMRKILITAKVRELTPDGERRLTDFTRPSYLEMLNELGKELGEESLSKLPPEERANALRLALTGKQALIVFDNLETLPEEERVRLFQFLSRLPEGNKAIVTSRRRSDVDARLVRLDRLSHDEAMQLITELAKRYRLLEKASQKERDDLYAITTGNPLFIRWIAGQLGRAGSHCRTIAEACAFVEQAPPDNDPLEYIFGDLLETFTEDETKVLAALTHFETPAKPAWLAQMSGLPAPAAETALEDLSDRSILLADLEARSFYLPPLTAQFIKTRRPEAVAQTGDALCNRVYALVIQYGGRSSDYEKFPKLEPEWPLLVAALPRFLQGENARLQSVCSQLNNFLNFSGRWDDWLWLSQAAEARALAANDRYRAGWRAYMAGVVYNLRGQPGDVLACAARAAAHWQDSNPRNKATAIRLRGDGHRLQKDYPAALAAYCEAIEIFRSISSESDDVASVLNSLANVESINKDFAAAERDYHEALRIAKKTNNQAHIATRLGNLARLALDQQQWDEAERLAREALALAENIGRQELIAFDCHQIAQALLKQKRALREAETLARRAVEICAFLRMPDGLQAAQKTLAEIEAQLRGAAS